MSRATTNLYIFFVCLHLKSNNKQTNKRRKKEKKRKEPHVYYYYIKKYHLGNKQKKNYKFGLARFYSIHPSIQPTIWNIIQHSSFHFISFIQFSFFHLYIYRKKTRISVFVCKYWARLSSFCSILLFNWIEFVMNEWNLNITNSTCTQTDTLENNMGFFFHWMQWNIHNAYIHTTMIFSGWWSWWWWWWL